MEMYILIILSSFSGSPDLTSRFIEVNRDNDQFIITRSEFDYLGQGVITAEIDEDEYGLNYFRFVSNEDIPRQFLCEDDESSEYIHGDILENNEEVGEFILRKVSNVSIP
jgi:hypothetical protein